MKLVSVAEMRALEAAAFASGVSEDALQQRAGRAVAEEVLRLNARRGRVVALVGHGNNGRDGAVAAQWLAERGTALDLVLAPRHAVTPAELSALAGQGVSLLAGSDAEAVER